MQRTVCGTLSLTIIVSSLGGCASPPPRERVSGPQVFGYELQQPLSAEAFKALTYARLDPAYAEPDYLSYQADGAVLALDLQRDRSLTRILKRSRAFDSRADCQAALDQDRASLQGPVDAFNARHAKVPGVAPQVGEPAASFSVRECWQRGGRGADSQSYRYEAWASQGPVSAPSKTRQPNVVEQTAGGVLVGLFAIVMLPFALIGWGVDKARD